MQRNFAMHFVVKPTGIEMFQFLFFFLISFGVLLITLVYVRLWWFCITLVYVRLWWFCLLYRLWTHFDGFAYGTGWLRPYKGGVGFVPAWLR